MAKLKPAKQSTASKATITTPSDRAAGTKRKRDEVIPATPRKPAKAVKQEMQDCDICAETRVVYRNFPRISSCDHERTVCLDCYKTHFVSKINEDRALGWLACNCPLCAEPVSQEDAQSVLPRSLSKELDQMIRQAQRTSAINWLWCPAEGCGHGQLHELTKNPFVYCAQCKTKICFNHQRKWHEGMTCHEFDQMSNQDEAAKKDMEEIRRTTKPCPYCKMRVKKEGGCNHMVCGSCRKHWFWNDVPFDGEQNGDSAEILGGPLGAVPLGGEARHAVEQVIGFENDQIDNPRRALPLDVPLDFPRLGLQERITGAWQAVTQFMFPNVRAPVLSAPRANVADVRREPSPADQGLFLGGFGPVRDLGRHAVPFDEMVWAGERIPTRPSSPPHRPRALSNPARRTMTGYEDRSPQQIIDLTTDDGEDDDDVDAADRVVIDLTGEV